MTETKTATLKVPGARLDYEVTGAGPILLMISGAPADAGGFAAIAGQLADRYTVVTYDWRGASRSPLDEPPGEDPDGLPMQVHGDDAERLLAALGARPAYVLGCSGRGLQRRGADRPGPGSASSATGGRAGRARAAGDESAARRSRVAVSVPIRGRYLPPRRRRTGDAAVHHHGGTHRQPAVGQGRGRRS